jgi:hypothetical protein
MKGLSSAEQRLMSLESCPVRDQSVDLIHLVGVETDRQT